MCLGKVQGVISYPDSSGCIIPHKGKDIQGLCLGATDGRRRGCCVAEMMMMIMMMTIILLLLPKLCLLSFVLLLGLPFAVLRSNNYSVNPISRSVLFKTTQFFHPRISRSSPITKPHPPTRFYCPPQYKISKNVVFIHELRGSGKE